MKLRRRIRGLMLAVIAGLALTSLARADEWLPAKIETYFSADRKYRLTVIPRAISTPLNYFRDKLSGAEPAGQARGDVATFAEGRLEYDDDRGHWKKVWALPLVNDVAPVSALVSNSGAYVVTFDDWFSVGRGPNVVVIYGPGGKHIRSLPLDEIISPQWISTLTSSVSSTFWSGEPKIEEPNRLVLNVMQPGTDAFQDQKRSYAELNVDLSSGRVIQPRSRAWRDVNAKAIRLADIKKREDDRDEEKFLNPILAPKDNNKGDWNVYLDEIYFRQYFGTCTSWVTVLLNDDRTHDDYFRSRLNEIVDPRLTKIFVIGSSLPYDRFLQRLKELGVRPGGLTGEKVYLVADHQHRDALRALIAPSGADITIIDPMQPIAQPAARIRAHNGGLLPDGCFSSSQ
jgi:hypothetical protein